MSEIKSKEIKLVNVDSIIENPRNANRHSIEQIKRLETLIKYQGFRNPLVVSSKTGFLVAGHGRLMAAKNLGMVELPVIYQDFENEAQEYAYIISDNEIARWAELDKQSLYTSLEELDIPSLEVLGIENFHIDDIDLGDIEDIEGEQDFSKEIDEKNDYIVLLFDSKEDFKEAKEKLNISTTKLNLSCNNNPNLEINGMGRVIEGKNVIDRL